MPILKTRGRRRYDAAIRIGALGEFELTRDKEDADVGEYDADSREEDVDEYYDGGYDVFFDSRGDSSGDAGVD